MKYGKVTWSVYLIISPQVQWDLIPRKYGLQVQKPTPAELRLKVAPNSHWVLSKAFSSRKICQIAPHKKLFRLVISLKCLDMFQQLTFGLVCLLDHETSMIESRK